MNAPLGGATHHHADAVLLARLRLLDRLVDDEVHEGVESSQEAGHGASSVQLHCTEAHGRSMKKLKIP